jgi:hypothetical protein
MTMADTTSRVVHCECGLALYGTSDEALLKAAERHIELDHGQLLYGAGPHDRRRPIGRLYQTARQSLCLI